MSGFFVHRSHRVEDLADRLIDDLAAAPPADPFAPAQVVVGSRAMESWLRLRIATRSSVCANVAFPLVGKALAGLIASTLGEVVPPIDPWEPEALAWAIAAELPALLADPAAGEVRAFLGGDGRGALARPAWAWARQVADVFDRYALHRPDWVATWLAGGVPAEVAGAASASWQTSLWPRLARRLDASRSLAERARRAAAVLARPGAAPSADSLHVFGLSGLPPLYLDLLWLLGRRRAVHLYAFVPVPRGEPARQHPLAASLGRLSSDFQQALDESGYEFQEVPVESVAEGRPPAGTLLSWLHEDLRAHDGAAGIAARRGERALEPGEDSFAVHACHGPTRQVEVLREAILGLLAAHPDLEPRDVLVVTPDIATYGPLVQAIFSQGRPLASGARPTGGVAGPGGADGPRDADTGDPQEGPGRPAGAPPLPVAIADLGLRQVNPVADALLRVLALAEGRVAASEVADLLGLDPVRRRFDLEPEDVDRIRGWIRDAGIRWGRDAAHRERERQPADGQNTWRFGLDRLALGALMTGANGRWEGVLPFDPVEGQAVEILGRFLAFARTLDRSLDELRRPRPPAGWRTALHEALADLTRTAPRAGWLAERVRDGIDQMSAAAEAARFDGEVQVGAIRHALEGRFDLPLAGDRPITGAVTVGALRPLRSVPYPVVCLLGMDDGVFPRRPAGHGFDLTRAAPRRAGDRDARDEDRHLLLEAILSARRHLLVLYTGRDPRTNEPRPPAAPIAALLDAADAACHVAGAPPGCRPRDRIVAEHPLQPFGPANFQPDRPAAGRGPWSFDERMRQVAEQLRRPRTRSAALFGGPLPDPPALDELALDDLVRFLQQPVRYLLHRRLGLFLGREDDDLPDREPIEPAGLERWQLHDELLRRARAEGEAGRDSIRERLAAEGRLPLGAAGRRFFAAAWDETRAVLDAAQPFLAGPRETVRVRIAASGLRLTGEVPEVGADGTLLVLASDGPDKPRYLLAGWVGVLALASAGRPVTAHVVGATRSDGVRQPVILTLAPPGDPGAELAALVALHRQGCAEPLRLCERTSHAFAWPPAGKPAPWETDDRQALAQALARARKAWEGSGAGDGSPGEGDEPHLAAVFPERPPYEPDDDGPGVHPEFARRAEDLWRPIRSAIGGDR